MTAKRDRTSAEHVDLMRNLLAFILVGAFVFCIPLFVFQTIPESNNDIIVYMVGQLSGMALTGIGFYFVKQAGQDALDEKRSDNTGKMATAVTAALQANTAPASDDAAEAAEMVADAAVDKSDAIAKGVKR